MIHLVIGRQGSGKTLFLVKKAYESYLQGKTVYSNVHLMFPYIPLRYDDIVNFRLNNAIVIIDEAHQLLPSRRSLSKRSVKIVDGFISMVRKKNLELYMSTQMLIKIDIRIREEQDFYYKCSKWSFLNGHWQEVTHNYDLPYDVPIMISLKVIELFSGNDIQLSFIGNNYFNMYDSKEIIDIDEEAGMSLDKVEKVKTDIKKPEISLFKKIISYMQDIWKQEKKEEKKEKKQVKAKIRPKTPKETTRLNKINTKKFYKKLRSRLDEETKKYYDENKKEIDSFYKEVFLEDESKSDKPK